MIEMRKSIRMLIFTILYTLMTQSDAQTSNIIEGPRSGGMGVGTMVMLVVIILVVVFCVVMHVFAEETTWGCIFGIIIVLIVFGILMLCPRGPVYEEVPSETEYVFKEVKNRFVLFFSNIFRTHTHTHTHSGL